ncbi:MAG: ThiF family adenylyltransferase [Candidatus Magasanikbacteria bacterium]
MVKDNFDRHTWQPVKVSVKGCALEDFIKKYPGIQIVDQLEAQLEELFLLRHPQYRFNREYQKDWLDYLKKNYNIEDLSLEGEWFYFPWSNRLVHYLGESFHNELRTGRNRNLITAEEQEKYYRSSIGILGMSVGSHVALTIAMTGGAKFLKLADPDTISGSNLNRIRSGFDMIGLGKVVAVARQIAEINPYVKVSVYEKGLTEENIDDFLRGEKELDLVVEEMDNPYLKLLVREKARFQGLPVIMAADNGDGVVVDVERFDFDKNYPILHGILGNKGATELKQVEHRDLPGIIAKMAGAEFAAPRMMESVSAVGKSLYSWPQLGTAATLCGSVLTNLGRRILLGDSFSSGRYVVGEKEMFKKVI